MAECVISSILDTDTEEMVPACVVHTHYAPCPRNGEPASTTPLWSCDAEPGGRDAVLAYWEAKTRRQRPLELHHGGWGPPDHEAGSGCWCKPELLPAEEVDRG